MQAKPYWKKNEASSSFFIGEHAYFNGGWHEKKHSGGGRPYPYRRTTLDTVIPTVTEMKEVLAPLDELMQADLTEGEEKAVLECEPSDSTKEQFGDCASSLLTYLPVPTNSRPEDVVSMTTEHPIPGDKYPYPTTITITPVPDPIMNWPCMK